MRYDQLPAAMQAQVDAKLGRSKPKRINQGLTGGLCPYRCHQCGEESLTWPRAQAHADASGHVRQDLVLS